MNEKALKRKIVKFVKSIDKEICVVFHDDGMESMPLQKIIFVDLEDFIFIHSDEEIHRKVLKQKGYIIDIMIPTYYILHEIGHIETLKQQVAKFGLIRQYMRCSSKVKGLTEENLKRYKQNRLEQLADNYAYNYYLHNYKKVQDFNQKILNLVK